MLNNLLLASGDSGEKLYVEDVFSTYLYSGTSASQTITNGIDLSGKGGLVWTKGRTGLWHILVDTQRGASTAFYTNQVSGSDSSYTNSLTAFNSDGYSLGADSNGSWNSSGNTFVSWTFRKAKNFFDIVTWTGNGSNRTISHSLGSVPGMIFVKRTDTDGDWQIYHRSLANTEYLVMSAGSKATSTTMWNSTTATSTTFSLGTDTTVNANGGSYIAYLFAHDAGGFGNSGTDSVVQCGLYTGNGSSSGPSITLGWEPQYLLIKAASGTTNASWYIFDNMRGIITGVADPYLRANTASAEATTNGDLVDLTPTGFVIKSTNTDVNTNTGTYIYLAIRRGPMRTPTDATKVFKPVIYNGDGNVNRVVDHGITTDMVISATRDTTNSIAVASRLTGRNVLKTTANDVESANRMGGFDVQTGVKVGEYAQWNNNISSGYGSYVHWAFRRAPGFFDVVCYNGSNSPPLSVKHNLGVKPELILIKNRTWDVYWAVYNKTIGATKFLILNGAGPASTDLVFSNIEPTATDFTVNYYTETGGGGNKYIAYLFASCPGVSKVATYSGTGATQNIDCGFSNGARFVLIKAINDSTGWYVFDTARGITTSTDPLKLLNASDAEYTSYQAINPLSSGFSLPANNLTNQVNVNYIYLAIA